MHENQALMNSLLRSELLGESEDSPRRGVGVGVKVACGETHTPSRILKYRSSNSSAYNHSDVSSIENHSLSSSG